MEIMNNLCAASGRYPLIHGAVLRPGGSTGPEGTRTDKVCDVKTRSPFLFVRFCSNIYSRQSVVTKTNRINGDEVKGHSGSLP